MAAVGVVEAAEHGGDALDVIGGDDHRIGLDVTDRCVRQPPAPVPPDGVVDDGDQAPVGGPAQHGQLHDERAGDGVAVLADDGDGPPRPEVSRQRNVVEQSMPIDDRLRLR